MDNMSNEFNELPDDVKKSMRDGAARDIAKATDIAKKFTDDVMKELDYLPAAEQLTVLAVVATDIIAEVLVLLDHKNLQPLNKMIPLMSQRMVDQINHKRDALGTIVIAKRSPPSEN